MDRDYRDALDELQFSPEAKRRLAHAVAAADAEGGNEDASGSARGRRRRYALAAAAAATLALVAGCTAYATGFVEVGEFVDDLFAGAPAQTEVIDKIGRPVGARSTSNGVTITADAIIGDQAHCAVVFSIARDDGKAFENIDVFLNEPYRLAFDGAHPFRVGNSKYAPEYYFYDADPSDNAIQCVVKKQLGMQSGSLIGKTMHADLHDLLADKLEFNGTPNPTHTVAEGTWEMSFVIDYEDTSVSLPAGQTTSVDGSAVSIQAVTISPISVVVEYTVDATFVQEDEKTGELKGTPSPTVPTKVNLRDDTVIEVPSGGAVNDHGATLVQADLMFDRVIDLDSVVSVTVGDVEIPMP